jgi:hypothetical protein
VLKDVLSIDEEVLFHLLPLTRHALFEENPLLVEKERRQCITLLFCANVLGTNKQKIIVIWNDAGPDCFKHIKTMPCSYKNNSNA